MSQRGRHRLRVADRQHRVRRAGRRRRRPRPPPARRRRRRCWPPPGPCRSGSPRRRRRAAPRTASSSTAARRPCGRGSLMVSRIPGPAGRRGAGQDAEACPAGAWAASSAACALSGAADSWSLGRLQVARSSSSRVARWVDVVEDADQVGLAQRRPGPGRWVWRTCVTTAKPRSSRQQRREGLGPGGAGTGHQPQPVPRADRAARSGSAGCSGRSAGWARAAVTGSGRGRLLMRGTGAGGSRRRWRRSGCPARRRRRSTAASRRRAGRRGRR